MPKIILNGVDYYESTISGGDSVEWSQIETSGTKIAEVTINGDMIEVYAPSSGGSSGINYSTQEQVVGTWIDGKSIYQKSFAFSPPFSSGNNNLTLNIPNAIIRYWEVYVLDNVSDPVTIGEGSEIRVVNANSSRIVVWIASGTLPYLSNGEIEVTVRYTKTTDV